MWLVIFGLKQLNVMLVFLKIKNKIDVDFLSYCLLRFVVSKTQNMLILVNHGSSWIKQLKSTPCKIIIKMH